MHVLIDIKVKVHYFNVFTVRVRDTVVAFIGLSVNKHLLTLTFFLLKW